MPPSPEKHALRRLAFSGIALGGSLATLAYQNQYEVHPTVQLRAGAHEATLPSVMETGQLALGGCQVEISIEGMSCPEIPTTTTTTLPPPETTTTTERQAEVAARQPRVRASRQDVPTTTTEVPPTALLPVESEPIEEPPIVQPEEPTPDEDPMAGDKYTWMNKAGIPQEEQGYVDAIVTPESKWNPAAVSANECIGLGQNCPYKGKYFLPQACPNWKTDPVCQLKRFSVYAKDRYGGWRQAHEFRRRNGWW